VQSIPLPMSIKRQAVTIETPYAASAALSFAHVNRPQPLHAMQTCIVPSCEQIMQSHCPEPQHEKQTSESTALTTRLAPRTRASCRSMCIDALYGNSNSIRRARSLSQPLFNFDCGLDA
jgi:hypothetical protein